jgi:hypothetical protein
VGDHSNDCSGIVQRECFVCVERAIKKNDEAVVSNDC